MWHSRVQITFQHAMKGPTETHSFEIDDPDYLRVAIATADLIQGAPVNGFVISVTTNTFHTAR